MNSIIFIATGWGAIKGGINSFNYDIVRAIAGLSLKNRIFCVVSETNSEEMRVAEKEQIELILVDTRFNSKTILDEVLNKFKQDNFNPEKIFWVGHDIITGFEAVECSELCSSHLGKISMSAVIHHMSYINYSTLKHGDALETEKKDQMQRQVLARADVVFGVGPYLTLLAENKLIRKKSANVYKLVPGIVKELDNLEWKGEFKGITFGRLGSEDDIIKQGKLAAASFFKMCRDNGKRDTILTVIGLDKNELEMQQSFLQEMGSYYAERLFTVNGLPYQSREKIFEMLREQSVAMMLSTHEGFGLAGWEAISAEVPLVVSEDTGLYKFLYELGGWATGCVFKVKLTADWDNNVNLVSAALTEIERDLEKARENAKYLKQKLLDEGYTWNNAASMFLQVMTEEGVVLHSDTSTQSVLDHAHTSGNVLNSVDTLYSTTTLLAYKLGKRYYNDNHYVWCAPKFDAKETNPASANPIEIYKKLMTEINNKTLGATISKHKLGIIRGAAEMRKSGKIKKSVEQEIRAILKVAGVHEYKPVIFIIPKSKVLSIVESAPHSSKAEVLSQEFLIKELPGTSFDVINLDV